MISLGIIIDSVLHVQVFFLIKQPIIGVIFIHGSRDLFKARQHDLGSKKKAQFNRTGRRDEAALS